MNFFIFNIFWIYDRSVFCNKFLDLCTLWKLPQFIVKIHRSVCVRCTQVQSEFLCKTFRNISCFPVKTFYYITAVLQNVMELFNFLLRRNNSGLIIDKWENLRRKWRLKTMSLNQCCGSGSGWIRLDPVGFGLFGSPGYGSFIHKKNL